MSDVMWIVINHEEDRPGLPFRANPFGLFVMSDVMLNCKIRCCEVTCITGSSC
jgi:hypothetical protein